ncbi:MAG: tetratricopeptide repeat protein, partial [Kiloniellaceae bacterium]
QPEHLSAGVARANLRLRDGDIAATAADLARLKARAPMNAQVLELEGNLAVAQGRFADAAKAYGTALRQAASSGLVAKLVIARQRAGDADGAISVMESWLRQYPDDTGIRSLLGVQYIASAKMDKAEASFKAILKRKPNNAPALNNLAWIETERGDLDAALSHARRANDLASGDAAVQDTLAVVHLRRGEAEQALPLLRDAVQKAPDNPEIGFHLAQALARSDEPDEARRILREILAMDQPFRGRADAQALLRELDS